MIQLTEDMETINELLHDPDVWPAIAPVGVKPFDFGIVPGVLFYLVNDGDGAIMFHHFRDGWKIHTAFPIAKRGKLAYEAIEQSIQAMFADGWVNIYAEIDRDLRHVRHAAVALGFKLIERGERNLYVRRNLDG